MQMTLRRLRRPLSVALLGWLCLACGCISEDGHLNLLGYSTRPNYDTSIQTVYVPIFKNEVFQAGPFRGLEFELTRAVIDEIHKRTPYRVISDPERADTELRGIVVFLNKGITNYNQENEVRELELTLGVDLVWYDYRTGRYLTNPRPSGPDPNAVPPFDPTVPAPPPAPPELPIPVRVSGVGRGIPEVGESTTSALTLAIRQLAVNIATMMEQPW